MCKNSLDFQIWGISRRDRYWLILLTDQVIKCALFPWSVGIALTNLLINPLPWAISFASVVSLVQIPKSSRTRSAELRLRGIYLTDCAKLLVRINLCKSNTQMPHDTFILGSQDKQITWSIYWREWGFFCSFNMSQVKIVLQQSVCALLSSNLKACSALCLWLWKWLDLPICWSYWSSKHISQALTATVCQWQPSLN